MRKTAILTLLLVTLETSQTACACDERLNPNFQMFEGRHFDSWKTELNDKVEAKRLKAVLALESLAGERESGEVASLMLQLVRDKAPRVRVAAIHSPCLTTDNGAFLTALIECLSDSSNESRLAAANRIMDFDLSDFETEIPQPVIQRLLQDKSADVRRAGNELQLKTIDSEKFDELILKMLEDPDDEIKRLAIQRVTRLDDQTKAFEIVLR